MRYEAYERRIKKVAKVLALISKHIVLTVSLVVVLVSVIVAFVYFKGTIIKADCSESFAYGEQIAADAYAFCSGVRYEYLDEDGSWSENAPVLPGEYSMRVVSKRSFGSLEYSPQFKFEILARPIDVCAKESVVLYGEKLTANADLAEGDRFECVDFEWSDYYSKILAHSSVGAISEIASKAVPAVESIKIVNASGEDVTHAYAINAEEKEVGVLRRYLKVTVEDKEKEYDGIELAWDVYEISEGSLAEGDLMVATFSASILDVGSQMNSPRIVITDKEGRNVDGCYILELEAGTISVGKRSLYVTTGSGSWVYDGHLHSNKDYELASGTLLDGHMMEISHYATVDRVIQGKTDNSIFFRILDAQKNDVSVHYSIMLNVGQLEITPRQITTSIPDIEFTYDGKAHGLARLLYFDKTTGELQDPVWNMREGLPTFWHYAGEYETFDMLIMILSNDETQEDLADNFDITVESYGTVTVHKRQLTVKSKDFVKVYDDNRYDHINWLESVIIEEGPGVSDDGGLCVSHSAYIVPTAYEKNVGVYENSMFFSIYDVGQPYGTFLTDESLRAASIDVSRNYEIVTEFGRFEIQPRQIVVTPIPVTKVYDGTPVTAQSVEAKGLLAQHILKGEAQGSITEVDESGFVSTVKKEGISICNIWGEDVTQNYAITTANGMLAVTPKPLVIYTKPLSAEYDGKRHEIHELEELTFLQLMNGHELSYEFSDTSYVESIPRGQTIGRAANSLDKSKTRVTRTSDGKDMTVNYAISYKFGLLTLNPRPLTIKTPSASWMYDGESHSLAEFTHIGGVLLEGHSFADPAEVNMGAATIVRAGDMDNRFSNLIILTEEGKNVSSNYKITQECGLLTVTRRDIILLTDSASKVFDYKYLEAPNAIAHADSPNELVSGDVVSTANNCRRILYVGEVPNTAEGWTITNAQGENVTDCYNVIGWEYGTLTVTKCPITVVTPSYTRYFDGTALQKNKATVIGAPEGFFAMLGGTSEIIKPGSIPNTCDEKQTRVLYSRPVADDEEIFIEPEKIDLTENFEIVDYEYGNLTVLEGTLVYVRIVPTVRMYAGKALGIDFEYVTRGYQDRFSIDFSPIELSLNKVGRITLEDLLAQEYKAIVTPKDQNDTEPYGVRFIMDDTTPVLRVTRRSITISAASATFNYSEGQTFTHNVCNMTVGTLAEGHRLEANCTGSIYCSKDTANGASVINEIRNFKIYDSDGNDVTKYYIVITTPGTLRVVNVPELE
jgi:uncharacterized protein YnzC (UPF0291/DUF896 family)